MSGLRRGSCQRPVTPQSNPHDAAVNSAGSRDIRSRSKRMTLKKLTLLRHERCLCKNGIEASCQIWSDGSVYEARLVKSGTVILRDRARWEQEIRSEHGRWRDALERLEWKREMAAPQSSRPLGTLA